MSYYLEFRVSRVLKIEVVLPYRELRVDGSVVDVVSHILDFRIIFALGKLLLHLAVERSHGGEG